MKQRSLLALVCFGAATLWPSLFWVIERAFMSPLERALSDAICGMPDHAGLELLGHCAACWAGSALLIATGIFLLTTRGGAAVRAR
ncbi:MAG: hypothetical protein R3C27_03910 [Hyphomonadaceae bacterium]